MKKIVLVTSAALLAFAVGRSFAEGKHKAGSTYTLTHGEATGQATNTPAGQGHYGEMRLSVNTHAKAVLPSDVRSSQNLGFPCVSTTGERRAKPINGDPSNCLDYGSASTHENFRVQFGQNGMAERVFQRSGTQLALHAHREGNQMVADTDSARRYAQANGVAAPTVAAAKPAPVTPAVATAAEDCSKGNMIQQAACFARKSGVGK